MNTGKDDLIVRIRYSPSTKEISYLWIQEHDNKHVSLDRRKEIAIAIATAICPPEDTDVVKAWVSKYYSSSEITETMIHGVPYFMGTNFFDNFVFSAGFKEEN
jgi:hypothetical protein